MNGATWKKPFLPTLYSTTFSLDKLFKDGRDECQVQSEH
jgi:hypothetical protein